MRKPSFRLLFLMAENKKPRKAQALQGVFHINPCVRLLVLLPALDLQLILAQCAECLDEG